MTLKNPWFLITFEEIEDIRNHLQQVQEGLPETYPSHVGEIAEIIDLVEGRYS